MEPHSPLDSNLHSYRRTVCASCAWDITAVRVLWPQLRPPASWQPCWMLGSNIILLGRLPCTMWLHWAPCSEGPHHHRHMLTQHVSHVAMQYLEHRGYSRNGFGTKPVFSCHYLWSPSPNFSPDLQLPPSDLSLLLSPVLKHITQSLYFPCSDTPYTRRFSHLQPCCCLSTGWVHT